MVPVTPAPGSSSTAVGKARTSPRVRAAATTAWATVCCEVWSRLAASRRTSSLVVPGADWMAATRARPAVSVPVLSRNSVRTRANASSAPPPFTSTPRPAQRDRPETMATGTPRISGHGVATTMTARPRTGSPLQAQAPPARARASGVNRKAARSASRADGAFASCACRTSRTMPANVLSAAPAVATMSKGAPAFTAPLRTAAPVSRVTGMGSPVSANSSRTAVSFPHDPVHRHGVPGPYQQAVSGGYVVERDGCDLTILVAAGGARNAREQGRHFTSRPRLGEILKSAAAREHDPDHAGGDVFSEREGAADREQRNDVETHLPPPQARQAVEQDGGEHRDSTSQHQPSAPRPPDRATAHPNRHRGQ